MNILVTGGTGYIGSHTVVELIKQGHNVVIVDNLSNSHADVVDKIETITGVRPIFYKGDIREYDDIADIFARHEIHSVIHFAGLKAVGESVAKPLYYYENNVGGTINLCKAMEAHGVKSIVFSSSATVYGDPETLPITETAKTGGTTNPYGTTKLMIEKLLEEWTVAFDVKVTLLRYFNPIGAHSSALIGENPRGIPNNLLPYIIKVAAGELPHLGVFGDDYDTPDGTGVRDYIHVVDLAMGHVAALERQQVEGSSAVEVFNLGTGKGTSVLEMITAFERSTGVPIPYKIQPRRPGDIATCYADCTKAETLMSWKAVHSIDEGCKSGWKFWGSVQSEKSEE